MSRKNFALPLMAHVVAGWPSLSASELAALALASGGASYLELQFPFSDPCADGPAIESACAQALSAGFTPDQGFALAKRLVTATGLPLFIMSYANLIVARGVARFCADAGEARAIGIIAPDLCPGSDEGLYAAAEAAGILAVPVLAPGMDQGRLYSVLENARGWVYAALRTGITGERTNFDTQSLSLLKAARASGNAVMAGFGIRDASQLAHLSGQADAAVVGSHFCLAIGRAAQAAAAAPTEARRTGAEEPLADYETVFQTELERSLDTAFACLSLPQADRCCTYG